MNRNKSDDFNPTTEDVEPKKRLDRAIEGFYKMVAFKGIVFAEDDERENNSVYLMLRSPQGDKNYMLVYCQEESRKSVDQKEKRTELFNYIVSATCQVSEIRAFNQIGANPVISGWEFYVDRIEDQEKVLDYCLRIADLMSMELKTEEDFA